MNEPIMKAFATITAQEVKTLSRLLVEENNSTWLPCRSALRTNCRALKA